MPSCAPARSKPAHLRSDTSRQGFGPQAGAWIGQAIDADGAPREKARDNENNKRKEVTVRR